VGFASWFPTPSWLVEFGSNIEIGYNVVRMKRCPKMLLGLFERKSWRIPPITLDLKMFFAAGL